MKFEIKLFATLRDLAGSRTISVQLDEPVTVSGLLAAASAQYPAIAPTMPIVLVSVNKQFAEGETAVSPQDEIAFFPPVSGGSPVSGGASVSGGSPVSGGETAHPVYFAVTTDTLDINSIHAKIKRDDVGAIVSFTGAVRGQTDRDGLPPQTSWLEYEAYNEMAELKMAQIAREIWERWPLIKGIAIVQRIGRLDVGETTTFVACAAPHRDQGAFDAALYGIDRLKEIVPVWKKEIGQDKSEWVHGRYHPTEQDNKQQEPRAV